MQKAKGALPCKVVVSPRGIAQVHLEFSNNAMLAIMIFILPLPSSGENIAISETSGFPNNVSATYLSDNSRETLPLLGI